MESIVVKLHSTDIVGTCDRIQECGELSIQLNDLDRMGLNQEGLDTVSKQRQLMCARAGQCTLYYGTREEENA